MLAWEGSADHSAEALILVPNFHEAWQDLLTLIFLHAFLIPGSEVLGGGAKLLDEHLTLNEEDVPSGDTARS